MSILPDYLLEEIIRHYIPDIKPKIIYCDNLPDFWDIENNKSICKSYLEKYNFGDILEELMGIKLPYLVGKTKLVKFHKDEKDLKRALIEILKDKEEYEVIEKERKYKEALSKQLHGKRKLRCECCGALLDGTKREDDSTQCTYCGAIQDYYVIE